MKDKMIFNFSKTCKIAIMNTINGFRKAQMDKQKKKKMKFIS